MHISHRHLIFRPICVLPSLPIFKTRLDLNNYRPKNRINALSNQNYFIITARTIFCLTMLDPTMESYQDKSYVIHYMLLITLFILAIKWLTQQEEKYIILYICITNTHTQRKTIMVKKNCFGSEKNMLHISFHDTIIIMPQGPAAHK